MWPAVVAEWLRRLTRNQFPSGSAGSNPADCENYFFLFPTFVTLILGCLSGIDQFSLSKTEDIERKKFGDGGYRSPYLSHAKRALYHLSYVPLSVKCQQSRQSVSAQFRFWRSLPANQNYLCVVHHVACQTFDSSVGRAVDCSCTLSDIHRSLVQIRLEGVFVLDQLLQSHLLCVSSIIVESCKMPG